MRAVGDHAPPLRRVLGFVALPLLSLLSPFLALPIIARFATIDQWSAVAIGQSVGTLASLITSYGFTVTGPAEVALTSAGQRPALWLESLRVRLVVSLFTLPAVVLAGYAIQGTSAHSLTAATAVASLGAGLSVNWFAIGSARPGLLAGVDAVPRAAGNLLGAVVAVSVGQLMIYPVFLLMSVLLPVSLFTARQIPLAGRGGGESMVPPRLVARLRRNFAPMATEVGAGAYSVAAGALIGATSTAAVVAHFNSAERVTRIGSTGIVVTGNSLQAWVAEARGPTFVARVGTSFKIHMAVGAAGLGTMALGGPFITGVLFGHRLECSRWTAVAMGVFYFLWSIETVTGRHVLAARGRTKALLLTTILGSAAGVGGVVVATGLAGADGAATALAGALAVIVASQLTVVRSVLRDEIRRYRPDSSLSSTEQGRVVSGASH